MPAVRQQINIAASPRTVWNALTTEDGVKGWWADDARLDSRAGGRIVLTVEGDDGAPVEERGVFHEVRPIRRIEIAWDKTSKGQSAGTRLEFQIARDGDETRLSLVQSGAALDEEELRTRVDDDWRRALRALRDSLETT